MLGFALTDTDILHAACILYSLALIAIGGRPALLRLKPQNEIDALKIAITTGLIGCIFYATLVAVLTGLGIEMLSLPAVMRATALTAFDVPIGAQR